MKYISFGAGVNSTALYLLLEDLSIDFEAVFVDTGTEWPETYKYLEYFRNEGYTFTWLKPWVQDTNNLYDYLLKYTTIPSMWMRMCTSNFKIRPFYKYIEHPATVYIGYDYGEYGRRHLRDRRDITYLYPLASHQLTRQGCKTLIKEHGLRVPPKSGCWFCPFQSKHEWRRLEREYPCLFNMAVTLERLNPRGFTFIKGVHLENLTPNTKIDDFV